MDRASHHRSKDGRGLRRGSDLVQSLLGRLLLVAVLGVLPLTAATVGVQQYHAVVRASQAQARTRHLVTAHLLADAPAASGNADLSGQVPALAGWTTPNGAVHGATVKAWPGQAAGTPVQVWIGPDGSRTTAPATQAQAALRGFQFAAGTAAVMALLCVLVWKGSRLVLDRYRYAQWEAEWARVEPGWSRRRPGRPG
ncbi:Rv1733c family protein [Streptacidiphilus jiangxiensis]|uniref:Uncharacterized protein n=1 Tax=Streptacidiphilus jiangxiensis TaxID=235985 RepID=A0A1H7QXG4_STRJI|nr:hypothetical protein [Streptacidiphilus jiangxiensis]SEL51997.1 hypothetical protein SAMN05414137_109240 [Streptacidiphilus jiangxiensis]